MTISVAGGTHLIGSDFVLDCLAQSDEPVINLNELTYAALLCANFLSATIDWPVKGEIALQQLVH